MDLTLTFELLQLSDVYWWKGM